MDLNDFYKAAFWVLLVITVPLTWYARPAKPAEIPKGFKTFAASFLSAWFFCVSADWLQGPYVYSLYEGYGFSKDDIAQLYVVAAISALFFGTFAGYVADRMGRKKVCIAYCVICVVGCWTKHYNVYWVLFFGRCLDGLATSILHTCFESWLVSQHISVYGFSDSLLSFMFSLMYLIMFLSAILAGLVGQLTDAGSFQLSPVSIIHPPSQAMFNIGGDITPFDIALVCVIIGLFIIAYTWGENFGRAPAEEQDAGSDHSHDSNEHSTESSVEPSKLCASRVIALGGIVAFFEGSMCVFVFQWFDALSVGDEKIPNGLIFTCFMIASLAGSSISELISNSIGPKRQLTFVLWASVFAFAGSAVSFPFRQRICCFMCFLVFEMCVGLYYPAVGELKSRVVPESGRAVVYNLYRIPLNMAEAILVLAQVPLSFCFGLCALLIVLALMCNLFLGRFKESEDVFEAKQSLKLGFADSPSE